MKFNLVGIQIDSIELSGNSTYTLFLKDEQENLSNISLDSSVLPEEILNHITKKLAQKLPINIDIQIKEIND